MVIYLTSELFGAKWRNWKILLKELDDDYSVKDIAYTSIYNLIIDPKKSPSFQVGASSSIAIRRATRALARMNRRVVSQSMGCDRSSRYLVIVVVDKCSS